MRLRNPSLRERRAASLAPENEAFRRALAGDRGTVGATGPETHTSRISPRDAIFCPHGNCVRGRSRSRSSEARPEAGMERPLLPAALPARGLYGLRGPGRPPGPRRLRGEETRRPRSRLRSGPSRRAKLRPGAGAGAGLEGPRRGWRHLGEAAAVGPRPRFSPQDNPTVSDGRAAGLGLQRVWAGGGGRGRPRGRARRRVLGGRRPTPYRRSRASPAHGLGPQMVRL